MNKKHIKSESSSAEARPFQSGGGQAKIAKNSNLGVLTQELARITCAQCQQNLVR